LGSEAQKQLAVNGPAILTVHLNVSLARTWNVVPASSANALATRPT
jgi:hypothetical protein